MIIQNNKTALVTGASKNLGRAIAVDLAQQGYSVAIHYHTSKSEAEKTLQEASQYSKCMLVHADVANEQNVKTVFESIQKQFGGVDVLVNLVGNFIFEPITNASFEKFKDVIESNLYATFLCCQNALSYMKNKKWGRIINFGCVAADTLTIREKTTPYYIAKSGVIMLTKNLAFEYAKYGITINSISPGILQTSIAKPTTPTATFAQFSDIINAIHFLLKDESSYINGANIEVAGGWRPGLK